jgi:hypothetical protein
MPDDEDIEGSPEPANDEGAAGGFRLTKDEEDELFASVQEIRNGDFIDGDELLAELRSMYRR